MKHYKTVILTIIASMAMMMNAAPVDVASALDRAAQFLDSNPPALQFSGRSALRLAHAETSALDSRLTDYYVINADDAFVIIAGDDRVTGMLAYGQGQLDLSNLPCGMQWWLNSQKEQMEWLHAHPDFVLEQREPSRSQVKPLLVSTWSQSEPYNNQCPVYHGHLCVTGCVATAMAQLLYYWKYPVQVTETLPAYTSQSLGIYMPALEPVEFNWAAMQDTYLSSDTESEGAQAAAQLTLYCAQSVKMNFLYGTSGANTNHIPNVLSTYFGFKSSAHCEYRENFTTQGWADFIYNELANNRPVVYSGSKASGGHAFICDGYDGEGMFHINWGWNSQSNGYFLLNVLNPDLQGTGSATGVYGYIYNQAVIVGIEPGEGTNEFALTATDLSLNGTTTTRSGTNYDFRATVTGLFRNFTSQVMAVSYGWALYQDGNFMSMLYETYHSSLKPGYYITSNRTLKFGSGITSGTYRIVPVYSEYYAGNWRPCIGADRNYIEVTINGNTCTITGHGNASLPDYTVNDITMEGKMNNGRPIDINVNLTNNGERTSRLLYMFVDGAFKATGLVDIANGETADIPYRFMPTDAGNYTLTWSWNDDGSDPIATRTVTITPMPEASLSGTLEVLNITDSDNKIVTSDKFSVVLTVTNDGSETYDEELSFKLYKHSDGNTGITVQGVNLPFVLEAGETKSVQVDFDNVINGWRYFANAYYYSAGTQTKIKGTQFFTIVFPEEPEPIPGDVNGDGVRNIGDVTRLINFLLGGGTDDFVYANADVDGSGNVSIGDVTALINLLLNGVH